MNNNKRIASGLPGFGTKGPTGDDGLNGLSIYFTDLDGEVNRQLLSDLIKKNLSLISNKNSISNERDYNIGDTFVDINSNVYEILLLPNNTYKSLGYKYVPNNIFESTNYINDFGYEKFSNVYVGDTKFLIDDVQSDSFAPNIYDQTIYGDTIGSFTKVNYTDLVSSDNLYLHEVFLNNIQKNNSLAIVSHTNANSTNTTFRIGSVKSISNGANNNSIFTPNDVNLSFDVQKLNIPKETYTVNSSGVLSKVITEDEYNMGVFKYLKSQDIEIENIVEASLTLADNIPDISQISITKCAFNELFEDGTDIKKVRVNILLNRVTSGGIIDGSAPNNAIAYDVPVNISSSSPIEISHLNGEDWELSLELIDETTGWSRYSNPILLSNTKIFLYARAINSTTTSKDFSVHAYIPNQDGAVTLYNKVTTIGPNSVTNIKIPILIQGVENLDTTPVYIQCESSNKLLVIKGPNGTGTPNYKVLKTKNNLLFHLGYDVTNPDFVYSPNNFKFLDVVTLDGANYNLNVPSSVPYNEIGAFYNNDVLLQKYGFPQSYIHTQPIKINIFNKTSLQMLYPKKLYYLTSDSGTESITSSGFLNRLKSVEISNLPSNVVNIFDISSYNYQIEVEVDKPYLYIFASDLSSVPTILSGRPITGENTTISYAYSDAYKDYYKYLSTTSYKIDNPYYNKSVSTIPEYYISISENQYSSTNNEFFSGNGTITYGNRANFGKVPNVMLNVLLSDSITLEPVTVGFSHATRYGTLNKVNNTIKFGTTTGIGCCVTDYAANTNNNASNWNISTSPFSMNGALGNDFSVQVTPNLTSYDCYLKACNYDLIYNRLFIALKDKEFKKKVNFTQNLFRPVTTSLLGGMSTAVGDKGPNIIKFESFNTDIPYYNSLDASKFESSRLLPYYTNRSDFSTSQVTLPDINSVGDVVDLSTDILTIKYTTSVFIDDAYLYKLDNIDDNYFFNHEYDHMVRDYTYMTFKYTLNYSYTLDDGKNTSVSGKYEFNSYDIDLAELREYVGSSNPYEIIESQRVNIGNDGIAKNNFKYSISCQTIIYQSFANKANTTSMEGDYNGYYLLSKSNYRFFLNYNPINVSVSNLGKRAGSGDPFINMKNESIKLTYKNNTY